MIKRVGKKGDTLVEVMLAIGIFSMVAIAVVAVMSSGTSSAQTALETTLTREEIDSQADALRFIQASYASDKSSDNFRALWQAIKDQAIPITNEGELNGGSFNFEYAPESCDALYQGGGEGATIGEAREHGFIVNMRGISNQLNNGWNNGTLGDNMIINGGSENGGEYLLTPTTTYPRLVFDDSNLLAQGGFGGAALSRAEGLYVVAVPDLSNTEIIEAEENQVAYYDFYIRSCWYGTGSKTPSTISTVMRLYNPDAIAFKPAIIADNEEEEEEFCPGASPDYIMVDTNMYIYDEEGGESFEYKGDENIHVDFEVQDAANRVKYTSTGLHDKYDQQCLDKTSQGLLGTGEVNISPKTYDWLSNSNKCQGDSLVSLQARSGKGGDLWYPAQVGDTLIVTIKSDEYQLYFEDINNDDSYNEDTEGTKNPYLCDAEKGVTCKYRRKGYFNYTTLGKNSSNENIEDIIDNIEHDDSVDEASAFGNADEFIITIPINRCAINTTADNYAEYNRFYSQLDGVITINTSWKRK